MCMFMDNRRSASANIPHLCGMNYGDHFLLVEQGETYNSLHEAYNRNDVCECFGICVFMFWLYMCPWVFVVCVRVCLLVETILPAGATGIIIKFFWRCEASGHCVKSDDHRFESPMPIQKARPFFFCEQVFDEGKIITQDSILNGTIMRLVYKIEWIHFTV